MRVRKGGRSGPALLFGALALSLSACASEAPDDMAVDPEGERAAASAAMDAVYQRFTAAYAAGEPDSVVALYTDAPLYLPARAPDVLEGRAALRAQFGFLADLAAAGSTPRIEFESVDRGASGDVGFDVGYYLLRVESPDGELGPLSRGKFVTVWLRGADGRWRIHVDGFSPAGPPAPATQSGG